MNRTFIVLCSVCILYPVLLDAQANPRTDVAEAQIRRRKAWMYDKWVGDDRAFQQIKAAVELALSQKTSRENSLRLYKRYEQQAISRPSDAKGVFAWGQALYRVWLFKKVSSVNYYDLEQAIHAMSKAPSPRTYSYTRLRYLLEKLNNEFTEEPQQVGERLLRRNPNDYPVKFYQVQSLNVSIPAQRQLALRYCQDLIRLKPEDPLSWVAQARVYRGIWMFSNLPPAVPQKNFKWTGTRNLAARNQAIAAYQKALQFVPTQSQNAQALRDAIARLKKNRF